MFQAIGYTTDHSDGDLVPPAIWPVHDDRKSSAREIMCEINSDLALGEFKGPLTVDYRRKGLWSEPFTVTSPDDKVIKTINSGLTSGTIDCVTVKSPEFVNMNGVVIAEYTNVYYIQEL